jgi:hypothetical protein
LVFTNQAFADFFDSEMRTKRKHLSFFLYMLYEAKKTLKHISKTYTVLNKQIPPLPHIGCWGKPRNKETKEAAEDQEDAWQ